MKARTVIALLVLFGSLPFAAASNDIVDEGSDIQGRALLFDLTRFDPDLAAIAGQASAKVSWLNGAITFDKGNDGWVFASTAGTGDPTKERLTPTGQWYNFTDANGATWNVREWTYLKVRSAEYRLGNDVASERVGYLTHVWSVKTSSASVRDELLDLRYNFVVVVDTAKLGMFPVSDEYRPGGAPVWPSGNDSGQVDLHFSRSDPEKRCLGCSPSS